MWRSRVANRARGEAKARLGDTTLALSLNLGALAAIEAEFNSESFEAVIDEVLAAEQLSATKFLRFMTAILEANDAGEAVISKVSSMMPADMRELALQLVAAAFPDPGDKDKKKARPANP